MIDNKLLEELVFTNPLGLLALRGKEDIAAANSYLPYSTGFEIECDQNKEVYSKDNFTSIPNIVEVLPDLYEQRYRIPNGINGLICLWHISNEAKRSLLLNDGPGGSGIHYHVDCTDCWREELGHELMKQRIEILKQLSKWENKGTYNSRGIDVYAIPHTKSYYGSTGSWVRANPLQTLEFRVGEMTFEYTDWIKCIVEINGMVKKVKDNISDVPEVTYRDVDIRAIMKYSNQILYGKVKKSREDVLKEKLAKLTQPNITTQAQPDFNAMRELIRNRTQNL